MLRANNFELAPTLEDLFASEEFYSVRSVGTQIKSPVQLVVGAHRELGIKDGNYPFLAQAVRNMGQDLFQPPNVKGWDGGRTWVNAGRVFVRYNAIAEALESAPRPGGQGGDYWTNPVEARWRSPRLDASFPGALRRPLAA